MMDSGDPPRLVDPSSMASSRLRRLIEDGRADVGTDADVRKLEAALVPMIWPVGGGPAGSGAATAAGAKGAAAAGPKVAIAALALAGASTLWIATSHAPPPAAQPRPPIATPTRAAVEAPSPPAPASEIAPASSIESQGPSNASGSAHRRSLDSLSEPDLLGQAQAALATDPGRSLSLAAQHSRRFPHGVLAQEREVIAIEALSRLGRRTEAAARAERFLQAFPASAHRSKIESIIGGK